MHAGKLCRFTCDQILEDGANTLITTTHSSWLQVHNTVVAALYSCPFGHKGSSTDPRLMSQCLRSKFLCSAAQKRVLKRLRSKCFRTSCTLHFIHTCQVVCAKQETASLLLQLQQLRNFHWRITTEYCCKAPLVQYIVTIYFRSRFTECAGTDVLSLVLTQGKSNPASVGKMRI